LVYNGALFSRILFQISTFLSFLMVNSVTSPKMAALPSIPEDKTTPPPLHIQHQAITIHNWYQKINWLNTTLIIFIPAFGLHLARSTPLTRPTLIWSIVYYFFTAFGITGGYHRLWSHRCYSQVQALSRVAYAGGAPATAHTIAGQTR
jgi:hypothetical protein